MQQDYKPNNPTYTAGFLMQKCLADECIVEGIKVSCGLKETPVISVTPGD